MDISPRLSRKMRNKSENIHRNFVSALPNWSTDDVLQQIPSRSAEHVLESVVKSGFMDKQKSRTCLGGCQQKVPCVAKKPQAHVVKPSRGGGIKFSGSEVCPLDLENKLGKSEDYRLSLRQAEGLYRLSR
eukprot:TRINITY_DN36862_c0_g1_i1.p2 TRINITY_DN36862_c0_g1~~TRINITY_DN36862_c0_g1_i1.p2  ORF type:complete len:130 (+),score=17.31 TRINITY_DN36862_c0_g1_i1:308-697(+)